MATISNATTDCRTIGVRDHWGLGSRSMQNQMFLRGKQDKTGALIPQCQATTRNGYSEYQCEKPGTYLEPWAERNAYTSRYPKGTVFTKLFYLCGTHAPSVWLKQNSAKQEREDQEAEARRGAARSREAREAVAKDIVELLFQGKLHDPILKGLLDEYKRKGGSKHTFRALYENR